MFFEHLKCFILPVILPMSLGLILCLWLSIKFSDRLKSLRYASIISFVMVFGNLIIQCMGCAESGIVSAYIYLIFFPGLLIAFPLIYILRRLCGTSDEAAFNLISVSSFIFYTLLIFGIIKLRHILWKLDLFLIGADSKIK
jgi:hypothetical protein